MAQPLPTAGGRVAVVDIGSNSVRLVVYEGRSRLPVQRFNEKLLCGLGRGLQRTGRLNEDGIAMALQGLARFRALARAMEVEDVDLVATEAVRAASNGAEFLARAEAVAGAPITLLGGEDEARATALGVVTGFHRPTGLVADIGGGSLELVALENGAVQGFTSLPLGVLRLLDIAEGDLTRAKSWIDAQILPLRGFFRPSEGRPLYIVGGNWRALARIATAERRSPIRVLHGFTMSHADALALGRRLARMDQRELAGLPGVPRKRVDTIAAAALLFEQLVRQLRPSLVRFSAFGLREGRLVRSLPPAELDADPLLLGAVEEGARHNRDVAMGESLVRWTAPLFAGETEAERRLRIAACHLADRAWRDHPDSRASQAAAWMLQAPLLAIDHDERAFLATTAALRHDGGEDEPMLAPVLAMLDGPARTRSLRLGRALQLGFRLSGAAASILDRAALEILGDTLVLHLPKDGSMPSGFAVEERLAALTRAFGLGSTRIVAEDRPAADA